MQPLDIKRQFASKGIISITTADITALAALATAIFAGIATFLSLNAAKATARVAQATQDLAAGGVLVNLLNAYENLLKAADLALQSKEITVCRAYYKQYFDLLWTEFQLWRRGLVPNGVMHTWMLTVHRSYRDHSFPYTQPNGIKARLSHRDAWQQMMRDLYFDQQDPFVNFIEHVYQEPAINIEALKSRFQVKRGD